jgi:hypothetical protein
MPWRLFASPHERYLGDSEYGSQLSAHRHSSKIIFPKVGEGPAIFALSTLICCQQGEALSEVSDLACSIN